MKDLTNDLTGVKTIFLDHIIEVVVNEGVKKSREKRPMENGVAWW